MSKPRQHQVHTLDRVVIRFAGDSGDGMQLTGDRFTAEAAAFGNDISTLPKMKEIEFERLTRLTGTAEAGVETQADDA